jgi:hypothetical protein
VIGVTFHGLRKPKPPGLPVQLNMMFCDASRANELITRCSTTGIILFLNGTPIKWYSKRQNTIESSFFGSEFVALKIATEMNDAMRYKLRMLGVINVTKPESTLATKET